MHFGVHQVSTDSSPTAAGTIEGESAGISTPADCKSQFRKI